MNGTISSDPVIPEIIPLPVYSASPRYNLSVIFSVIQHPHTQIPVSVPSLLPKITAPDLPPMFPPC